MQHLIDIDSLGDEQIQRLLARTLLLQAEGFPESRPGVMVNLFCEPSTRTRASFATAAARLGLSALDIDESTSSARKGETLDDTFANLVAMQPEIVVIRHAQAGEPGRLAGLDTGVTHIINAGDGARAHPTQALLDAYTLQQAGVDIARSRIVIAGDLKHSRVARSNLALLRRLGAEDLRLAAPAELQLDDAESLGAEQHDNFDRAIDGADVIMMLRVQHERITEISIPDADSWHRRWGLNTDRLDRAAPGCRVMHPGPMNRGVEISSAVADGGRSLILDQVRNGVCMRAAILLEMLESGPETHI